MKKQDFKKLALMGLSGGLLLAAEPLSADLANSSNANESSVFLAHNGCKNGCSNSDRPQGGNGGSCGNSNGPRGSYSSCANSNGPRGSSCGGASSYNGGRYNNQVAEADVGVTNPGLMSETDFVGKLNPQAKATYQGLDAEGKALALKLANATCKGLNDCKGLNSCKSDTNACAGQGSCAGKSGCSFKNKNDAVKVAAMKMAQKRAGSGK